MLWLSYSQVVIKLWPEYSEVIVMLWPSCGPVAARIESVMVTLRLEYGMVVVRIRSSYR